MPPRLCTLPTLCVFSESERRTAAILLTFSLVSASLLLVNKFLLGHVPLPALVSTLQFVVAATFTLLLRASGRVPVDDFEWAKVKPYCLYVCLFGGSIYTNMRALELASVETMCAAARRAHTCDDGRPSWRCDRIVFRSALPLLVSMLEAAFLGRALPSRRSAAALVLLAAGATTYMYTDKARQMGGRGAEAYFWATAYFVILSVEMCWGKYIVGPHLGLQSMWGPVLCMPICASHPTIYQPPAE